MAKMNFSKIEMYFLVISMCKTIVLRFCIEQKKSKFWVGLGPGGGSSWGLQNRFQALPTTVQKRNCDTRHFDKFQN
jgi:hypothetical protein